MKKPTKTKRTGRRPNLDRENTTGKGADVTSMQVFKRSKNVFDRLFINAAIRKNRSVFFDIIMNYVHENQKDFYNYFNKPLK